MLHHCRNRSKLEIDLHIIVDRIDLLNYPIKYKSEYHKYIKKINKVL